MRACGGRDLSFRELDLGLEAIGGSARVVELLLSLHAGVLQLLGATELDAARF